MLGRVHRNEAFAAHQRDVQYSECRPEHTMDENQPLKFEG
jgi:hypothetical protein